MSSFWREEKQVLRSLLLSLWCRDPSEQCKTAAEQFLKEAKLKAVST